MTVFADFCVHQWIDIQKRLLAFRSSSDKMHSPFNIASLIGGGSKAQGGSPLVMPSLESAASTLSQLAAVNVEALLALPQTPAMMRLASQRCLDFLF